LTLETLHTIKGILAGAVVALAAAYWCLDRWRVAKGRPALDVLLILLAAVCAASYFDFGQFPKYRRFMNPHDVFHYYLGSKYSREIGFANLYECVAIATAENHRGEILHPTIRKMDDYSFVSGKEVLAKADTFKRPFSRDRWQEFKKDVRYFESLVTKRHWRGITLDMGYNPTPVWNMTGRFLTNRVPTESTAGMNFLVAIDLALLAATFSVVGRTFGWRAGLFTMMFFCTHFCMSYTHIRGGFLRMDWLAFLVMCVCAIKTGRYKTAAGLLGYAGMARVFPIIFGFGMGAKFLWSLWRTRRIERKYAEFFSVLAMVCAALFAVSAWDDGGLHGWKEFAGKIGVHNAHIAPVRVGFKYVFLMAHTKPSGSWNVYKAAMTRQFNERKAQWWLMIGAALAVSLLAVRKLEDYESLAYGYVPAYFLTAPTFYYHIMMTPLLLLFLPKRDQPLRMAGVMGMFAVSITMELLNVFMPLDVFLSFLMSCMLLVLCLYCAAAGLAARPVEAGATPIVASETSPPSEKARHAEKSRKKPQ